MIRFVVKQLVTEAPGVKSFYLEPLDGKVLQYKSGQFLTLIFTLNGKEIRRSYSLGSSSTIDTLPFITVKRVENGTISRFLLDHVYEGMEIDSLEPAGRFYSDHGDNRDIVLSAAGSGIVPVFAIAKEILHNERNSVVHLFYGNRSKSQTIYLEQLKKLESEFPERFRITWFFSDLKNIRKARLTWEFLENYLISQLQFPAERMSFFVCGPETFMYMTEVVVKTMGFKNEQFRKELFVVRSKQETSDFTFDTKLHRVVIHGPDATYELTVQGNRTILEVAKEKVVPIPWSCESGQCSTCAVICVEGSVKMTNNEVLTENDLKAGLILTCTGHPVSDNVILRF